MYRLVLYYLIGLIIAAIGLSMFGVLHYNPLSIAGSAVILVIACWIINEIFSEIFKAPTNTESAHITALILALIISPVSTGTDAMFLLAAAGLAMASKYLLTINKKHIFNPAAIAVVLTALGPHQAASWWVGTASMLPFVLIGGILLVVKIRRTGMVLSFLGSTTIATVVYTLLSKGNVISALDRTFLSSAVFFLAFVMLTEPLTSPPTAKKQSIYGILAGLLYPPQVHFLSLYSTPELALVISNVFSYIVSPKAKLFLKIKEKLRTSADSADFVFRTDRKLSYLPGQYMEWTLSHEGPDSRGNRRIFTLASSPTEPDIRIGVKFYEHSSSFKKALLSINEEDTMVATQIAGDFVLPKDKKQKIVFIAGGIGVTPYRSMVKYLIDTNDPRDITLLYSAKNSQEFAYRELFEKAREQIGLKTIYNQTDPTGTPAGKYYRGGYIKTEYIANEVPDYGERLFYISGSHSMVVEVQQGLIKLGVHHKNIKADFFPGYA